MSVLKPLSARSRSGAEKLADKWFSLYIRLRDSDWKGIVKCITCPNRDHFKSKKINCGHFISRAAKSTRWHVLNANGQCTTCNLYKSGNQYEHGKQLDIKHGKGTADQMAALSRATQKFNTSDLLDIAEKFRKLALEEASKRGITL